MPGLAKRLCIKGHPQSLPPVLSLDSLHSAGARLHSAAPQGPSGKWDLYLERLTPSRTFQSKQPPSQRLSSHSERAHGKQAQAGRAEGSKSWQLHDKMVTKQCLQPQTQACIVLDPTEKSALVKKCLLDPTRGQTLQACPQTSNAYLCGGEYFP